MIFISCAAVMAPPGGDKDITPPGIVEILPPNGSTQFRGGRVELKFSEYLDENSIKKSINIFPLLQNTPVIIYKGDRLFIDFSDSLPENQTIIIIINRNLADEHKIKLAEGIQIAYSTGNKIDQGSIKGKIYYSKEASVNLWKIQDSLDILKFYNRVPDYTIDANDRGEYEFKYLSKGSYKIIAVDRLFGGLPIVQDRFAYGLGWKSGVNITGGNLDSIDMRIPIEKRGLKIVNAKSINGKWGEISFSNDISDEIGDLSVDIYYSDTTKAIAQIFESPLDPKKLNFTIDKMIDGYISVNIYNKDSAEADSGFIKIKMDTIFDTTGLKIINPVPKQFLTIEKDSIVPLKIIFSNLVEVSKNEQPFLLFEDSSSIQFNTKWESSLSANIIPFKNWKPKKKYFIKIYKDSILPIYSEGLKDSLIIIPFSTKQYQGFGSLIIKSEHEFPANMIAELTEMENRSSIFRSNVNSDGIINIKKLPEGNYDLFFYQDQNRDNQHSTGNIFPFQPAEWFQSYSDTVKIRANWEIELENIIINYEM